MNSIVAKEATTVSQIKSRIWNFGIAPPFESGRRSEFNNPNVLTNAGTVSTAR